MKNTIDAIKYGLETLNVSPKELHSLIESSNGYEGDDYKRWLSNEIIKIAEKDDIGFSQLLAKWFNIIQSIIEEYADDSIKVSYENKIKYLISNRAVYTIGLNKDNPFGTELEDIDWGSKVDLMFNTDFIDTLPEELSKGIKENTGVTLFVKLNPKGSFKKNCDIVLDAKQNGLSIKSYDALMLYRMCSIVRAMDDMCDNFKFVFMTDTKFLYDKENADIIKQLLLYFNYTGFVVKSKDLYEGSFTSEEYAFCGCLPRGVDSNIQNGIELPRCVEKNGELKMSVNKYRYSEGTDMLKTLFKKYSKDKYTDEVPMIDRDFNIVGETKGIADACGYMCKGDMDRSVVLSTLPIKDTNYIAITKRNLKSIIAYYGVSQSMDNSGMFLGIKDIINGHPDYNNLVANCVPLFLFDVNSKFCTINSSIPNKFDIISSDLVKDLLDKSSVYFSYEAKELMNVCKGFIDFENTSEKMVGKTFEGIRKEANNAELNKVYLTALSRCKDFVSSLYRGM